MYYELTDHFEVKADLETTWRFFSTAENLARITPDWMNFRIETPGPIRMERDQLVDYSIRWMGCPIRWRTKIIDYSPPRQFIDLQIRGPYALWHHQHLFMPGPTGTACMDRILYRMPLSVVGRLAHAMGVRRQLIDIFRYRRQRIAEELGWGRAVQPDVAITAL